DRSAGCGSGNGGGLYAFGNPGEYALGYLPSSTAPNGSFTATVTFVNNTGSTITALDISYNFENWRRESRMNGFTVTTNIPGGSTISDLNHFPPSSTLSHCTVVSETKSVSLTGLSIANGA